jgi:hypothetical protein
VHSVNYIKSHSQEYIVPKFSMVNGVLISKNLSLEKQMNFDKLVSKIDRTKKLYVSYYNNSLNRRAHKYHSHSIDKKKEFYLADIQAK